MSDITPINPSAGLPEDGNEDPFESMLDAESDDDFGYVVTKDRATGPDGHPVKLADWSAQDFASIYTRFRPHLERHARRFLNNPSQVDEVVQDAFLYLMVSLPELDSEIGVLRFLKWKTRLLCLDVIRASGKAYVANIDDVAEPMSSDPEVSSYLEQQDDAAVLRLALSKLNPRHREVLLASIYEEKSTQEIASQVGLSENATRQLIFRARSAFKKALLGEDVNTDGMSAAAILSVAARKAAQEAKKVGAQAMVLALFLMLAVGALVNFTGRGTQTQQLAESQAPAPVQTQSPEALAPETQELAESVQISDIDVLKEVNATFPISREKSSATPSASPFEAPWALDDFFDSSGEIETVQTASYPDITVLQSYKATSEQGVVATFDFAADAEKPFSNLRFTFEIEGQTYRAKASLIQFFLGETNDAHTDRYVYIGTLGDLTGKDGQLWPDTKLSGAKVRLELLVDTSANQLDRTKLVITANNPAE